MLRECSPPAREPASFWLARRSTTATSTPANASSPANISPVGPAPAITTACLVFDNISGIPLLRWLWFRPAAFYGMTQVLKQAPCAPHIRLGRVAFALACEPSAGFLRSELRGNSFHGGEHSRAW